MSMMPATAIVPPRNPIAERAERAAVRRPNALRCRTIVAAKKIAQSANAAQYWPGERSVMASRTFEMGANRSYNSGIRSLAVSGEAPVATSTSGGNEKAAVITSIPVITSGHRYRDECRSFRVCKSSVEVFAPTVGAYTRHVTCR
jgi:hypothetical protein